MPKKKEKYAIVLTLKNGFFYPQEKASRNIFDQKDYKV